MKRNTILFAGIAALALLFGFGLAGCSNSSNGDTGGSSLGETVKLEGIQVYENATLTPYGGADITFDLYDKNGSKENLSNVGLGPVKVVSGMLNLTLGTPANLNANAVDFGSMGLSVSNVNAKLLAVAGFEFVPPPPDPKQRLFYGTQNEEIQVIYIYADRAVTVTGVVPGPMTVTLNLKKGWNTAFMTDATKTTVSGTPPAGCKWIID